MTQQNYTLTEKDIQLVEQLLNAFPLGSCNVSQGIAAGNHAQQILNFLVSKVVPITADTDEAKKK